VGGGEASVRRARAVSWEQWNFEEGVASGLSAAIFRVWDSPSGILSAQGQ
jgi:hypothetical protein